VSRLYSMQLDEITFLLILLLGPGMDTGRVDPRVGSGRVAGQIQGKFGGSGRVGSKFLKCIIFVCQSS